MPTQKNRIVVTVDDWMWEAVENYRHSQRLISKSKAAIKLIEKGLEVEGQLEEKQEEDFEDSIVTLAAHADGMDPKAALKEALAAAAEAYALLDAEEKDNGQTGKRN